MKQGKDDDMTIILAVGALMVAFGVLSYFHEYGFL